MSRTIMLIPTSAGVGLTSVSMGVLRAMERKGVFNSAFRCQFVDKITGRFRLWSQFDERNKCFDIELRKVEPLTQPLVAVSFK